MGTRWKKLGTVGIVACLGIMVLLLFVVAGCGGGTETTTTAAGTPTTGAVTTAPTGGETSSTVAPTKTETLLIGASMPLSGPASVAGLAVANGWKAGVEKVNADGGITIGDTNYKLEIAIEDSKGTADGATTAATKLALQDNAKFILGDIADFMAQAIYAVSGKAGALYFNTLPINGIDVPGAIGTPSPDKPLLLDGAPPESSEDIVGAQYLVENYPNVKNIAVVALSFSDYDAYKEVYTKNWGPLGLTIVSYERFDPPTTDLVPVTTKLLGSKPDAICVSRAAIPHLIGIIKAAREQGFTGPIFYLTPTDISLLTQAGQNVTDVFGTGLAPDDPKLPQAAKDAIADLKAKYGQDFTTDSLVGYGQIVLLAQMIAKAQSVDPAVVEKTFQTLTNPGDLQALNGPAYAGGLETYGVNAILIRPVPISRLVDGTPEFVRMNDIQIP
ncbi:MAG TPA: ABC transporter substrate-binding protein [Thermoleophilia bacterium]|nr:ABC transporter substrate-binding protein [Thermoleophilia bacterium]